MASNYKQEGKTVTLTAPYALASGQGVLVGSIFGIAATAAGIGESVEVHRVGVFEVNKLATDVVTEGLVLYWDNGNRRLTITASTHSPVGHATKAAGNPSATVELALVPGAGY